MGRYMAAEGLFTPQGWGRARLQSPGGFRLWDWLCGLIEVFQTLRLQFPPLYKVSHETSESAAWLFNNKNR